MVTERATRIGELPDGWMVFENNDTGEMLKVKGGTTLPASDADVAQAAGFSAKSGAPHPEQTGPALVPVEIVKPMVTAQEAAKAMKDYQDLIKAIQDKRDYVDIKGKAYRKRSGWRKIARFFGLRWETVSETWENSSVKFIVKVSAPNGRYVFSDGACDKDDFMEGMKPTLHNIRSKAHTRAINRGIADLVGGGEVSAEEVQ